MNAPEQAHLRLEHLYEISKLFASFENVEQTLDPALAIVAQTLPLRSAILIKTGGGHSKMIVWPSEGQTAAHMQEVKERLRAAYTYLVGTPLMESFDLVERPGATMLPAQAGDEENQANRFIVIPLVVSRRRPFGALQLEGARTLVKADLMFVNAIVNQLAIALDRDRAWQRDITRREHAEEDRAQAEAKGAAADQGRIEAESSSDKYEALANENAKLLRQAKHAVHVREQLLAIVSHDLKNPLGAILMTAGILAKRSVPDERRKGLPQAIARIQRASERMLRIIDDLLDFASIEAGRLAIRRHPQDPNSIVQEALASFESSAQECGLQLTADIEGILPKLYCDHDRLLQVFSNLIGNAIKATAEGGHITVIVRAGGHEIMFTVSDDGPGINAEDVKHLFERYWRSGEAEYKGTGLGLAIAQGIVNAHGGRMWAESELGHGARFHFTIPVADETSLFVVPAPGEGPPFHGSGV